MTCDHSAQLPPEILELIVQHLPQSDLKQARLLNKSFCNAAGPVLFQRITIVPFKSCLQQFVALLRSSSLGGYVQQITYDDRWHLEFWDFARSLRPMQEGELDVVSKYHDEESIASDVPLEVSLLSDVFSLLPNVTEFDVMESPTSSIEDDPPAWFTPFMSDFAEGQDQGPEVDGSNCDRCRFDRSAVTVVMRAISQASRRCQTLNICCIDFAASGGTCTEALTSLSSLTKLNVSYKRREPALWNGDEKHIESKHQPLAGMLVNALSQASHLERLQIRGGGRYCDDREPLIKCFIQRQSSFRKLQTLQIEETPMYDQFLHQFLVQHRGVLKNLTLKNIILVHESLSQPHECLVELLRTIKTLRLNTFSFGGLVSNGGNQTWHFEDQYDFTHQLPEFIESRNNSFRQYCMSWACGAPGYGALVGGRRYPEISRSQWFDGNAIRTIESWILGQDDDRVCPMQQFAVQEGQDDYRWSLDMRRGLTSTWHAFVWSKAEWEFRYEGGNMEF